MDCAAKKCIQSKFTVATKIRQGGFDTAFNSFEASEKIGRFNIFLVARHSNL